MRNVTKKAVIVCLFVLFSVLLLKSGAFAVTSLSLENPNGEPPYGLAIQRDAQGTKVNGVAYIEVYNIRDPIADIRIALRLRKGKVVKMLYGEVNNVDISSPSQTQQAIMGTMNDQILYEFFNNDLSLQITLKGLEEFAGKDLYSNYPAVVKLGGLSSISIMDIELAVK